MLPKRIILLYGVNPFGKIQQKINEAILFRLGYYKKATTEGKHWNTKKAVGLGLVFLPLALLGKSQRIKVVYAKGTKKQ